MAMRALVLGGVVLLCACPSPGADDGGSGGGSAGGTGGGTSGAGGGAVARPERWIPSDDGTAVLWVPDGGAPADVAITVRRIPDAGASYELLPSGLTFSPPAVLFARQPAARTDAGIAMLEGTLVSEDGGVEQTVTVRAASTGNLGRQPDVVATVVPHFTIATFTEGSPTVAVALSGPLPAFDDETFRKKVGDEFDIQLDFQVTQGTLPAGSHTWTTAAAGVVELVSPPAGPTALPATGFGSFRIRVRCKDWGVGVVQVVVRSEAKKLRLGIAGLCEVAGFAEVLQQLPDLQLPEGEALDEMMDELIEELPEPKPAQPAQPVRDVAAPQQQGSFSYRLELDCIDACEMGTTYNGRYVITNGTSGASAASQVEVVLPDNLAPAGPQGMKFADQPLPGQSVTYPFTYACVRPGAEAIAASTKAVIFSLVEPPVFDTRRAVVHCKGPRNDDQVMMSTNRRVTRSGGSWVASPPGVTVNVGVADAALESKVRAVSGDTTVHGGVSVFTSRKGKKKIKLRSARQNVEANYDDATSRYVVTGAVASRAFEATGDTLTVEDEDMNVTTTPAPLPISNLDEVFGAPAAGATTISIPDGFAVLATVFMQLQATAGSPAGSYGLSRVVDLTSLPLVNGRRDFTLLEPSVASQLRSSRWTPLQVYVGFCLVAFNATLFAGQMVPVEACQMHQFTPADLGF